MVLEDSVVSTIVSAIAILVSFTCDRLLGRVVGLCRRVAYRPAEDWGEQNRLRGMAEEACTTGKPISHFHHVQGCHGIEAEQGIRLRAGTPFGWDSRMRPWRVQVCQLPARYFWRRSAAVEHIYQVLLKWDAAEAPTESLEAIQALRGRG